MSEFFKAVSSGEISKVKQMVESDRNLLNAKNDKGLSAIMIAAYHGKKSVAEFLIGRGATLSIFDAAATGKTEIARKTIQRDLSILNSYSSHGFMALHLAAFFGQKELAKLLIESGADVNAVSHNMQKVAPLHSAVASNQTEISQLLVGSGANVNAKQEKDFTPLHAAAQNGNVEIARSLIRYKADVNARLDDGRTPLALTKVEGEESGPREDREKVAGLLLQHGGKE
jgi:uncharacterized protein